MKKRIGFLILIFLCIFIFPIIVYAQDNGWVKRSNAIYYYKNGKMLKGIYEIDGKYYHFGEITGQLKKGWSITLDKK